ncbi:MAG TPA: hypothetical protein VHW65_07930 [Gemmatimonadales bacterium]|jgi:starvation-inducible outer membrane lipoprotein|nr:hypothetical protein [Gemmatimonadales bacterium]
MTRPSLVQLGAISLILAACTTGPDPVTRPGPAPTHTSPSATLDDAAVYAAD